MVMQSNATRGEAPSEEGGEARAPRRPLRPFVFALGGALTVALILGVGPWPGIGSLLAPADAQESIGQAVRSEEASPSEADRAALRYFAREGNTARLEAELRRLRALYPSWQPPRDLLDPQSEDTEIQEIYDLAGEQRFDEARAALAARRQRDPSYEPPAALVELLETAKIREELRKASDAQNYAEVLRLAETNERVLTCEDVDSIWRVADAFAKTGQPQRAYDAYAYLINTCVDQDPERAATLQKAATTLDPTYVSRLFALGKTDAGGINEFQNARLAIVRGALARGGSEEAYVVPFEWLELLADNARTGADLDDAMLVGFYLYRHGNPGEAAQWFRFALDNGHGADAAEAYIVALRATGDRENEFLAREVAYQWRDQTPELMEAYLDAMATILTADPTGERKLADVEQVSVDRFAPIVIEQRDANGAQALGWYAYNTCQYIIAEEWFISSANWVPTEAALYGLALARLRLGDKRGFEEIVDEWGPLYPSVMGLATGRSVDPTDPTTGARDDPTNQVGVSADACDPRERRRQRELAARRGQRAALTREAVEFTEAGSLTAAPLRETGRAAVGAAPAGAPVPPRRGKPRNLLVQVQATLPPAPAPSGATPLGQNPPQPVDPVSPPGTLSTQQAELPAVRGADPRVVEPGGPDVTRRVRSGETTQGTGRYATRDDLDTEVRRIAARPSRGGGGGGGGRTSGSGSGCVTGTNAAFHNGRMSAEQAVARGYCLMELQRPVEAAQAFAYARARAPLGSNAASDAAYGASLAAISLNQTNEASVVAASAPMSRARRTELQIQILTQRAVTASTNQNYASSIHYLEQRNHIAPMQKDLMVLQGYSYQASGDFEAAERLFQAANQSGGTSGSQRAVWGAYRHRYPAPNRPMWGGDYR